MNPPVVVRVGRTNTIGVEFGEDVSARTFSSQIRKDKAITSELIATWTVDQTDAVNGNLLLTLDDDDTKDIALSSGWMDIKMVIGGEPYSALLEPIEVVFEGVVTA